MQPPKLAILAGAGRLPGQLAAACQASGRECYIVAFKGESYAPDLSPDTWVDLAAVGSTLALLHEAGCGEVVLAGSIRRPSLAALRPDRRGAKLMVKLLRARGGDDALLSAVVAELEGEGLRVVGADDVLADLVAPYGPLGQHRPDGAHERDIAFGIRVVRALGALDVGQAAVVQQQRVLGVEAAEGTDALLARCAALRLEGAGGVLVKLKKPGQDARVDLPAIGSATIDGAVAAGLAGLAVEAGGALVFQRADVVAAADRAGLFVVGVEVEATVGEES